MAFFDFLFGGGDDSNLEEFELPEFQSDPIFTESQDVLFGLGKDILGGDFGAFSSLAETGSPEFEAVLANTIRDIQTKATEQLAAQGRARGGALADVTSRAVADTTANLRFQDFLRSQEGLGFLFQQGRGITEGVRGAGLTNQSQINQFALGRSQLDLEERGALDKQEGEQGFLEGGNLATLGGLAATGVGVATGNPALITLGSTLSGFDFSDILGGAEGKQKGVTDVAKGTKALGGIKKNRLLEDFNLKDLSL